MKQLPVIVLFFGLVAGLFSCSSTDINKPSKLIPKDDFIKMMVDLYVVQGINTNYNINDSIKIYSQTDLYYSVLDKYSVADTVFVRSLIYYSSFPKSYEKMHLEIVDLLKAAELQFKPTEKLQTNAE